jgi:hypothetical protein
MKMTFMVAILRWRLGLIARSAGSYSALFIRLANCVDSTL